MIQMRIINVYVMQFLFFAASPSLEVIIFFSVISFRALSGVWSAADSSNLWLWSTFVLLSSLFHPTLHIVLIPCILPLTQTIF